MFDYSSFKVPKKYWVRQLGSRKTDTIKNFIKNELRNIENKSNNIEELIQEKEWKIVEIKFDKNIIAIANTDNRNIILNKNNKEEWKENKDYILLHEYFHILENKFSPFTSSYLICNSINDLEWADIFAYKYFINKNEKDKIPKKIEEVLSGYILE